MNNYENLKFYKGLESNLDNIANIEPGALYHCTDTGNTYIGILVDAESDQRSFKLFSTASG